MLRNGLMSKSQTQCICGKPINMGNDEKDFGTGTTLEILGEKNKEMQLFHSIDCALISKRLESVYNNSNLFLE
jgi:hypothetical protein